VGLLRRNVRVTSPLAVEDVQRRLAEYTIDWGGDFYGRSVPEPPWDTSRFIACQGMASFWLSIPLAVSGSVEADRASTVVTAVIRPHGSELAKLNLAGKSRTIEERLAAACDPSRSARARR
jgi:hypothetical protein